ncbi:MAG: glycosyltransferase family 8 protein [Elusimicrobia bacterium]|nr:glycosyltransferase family 8 protein [Elusimicrobiota bacterium]
MINIILAINDKFIKQAATTIMSIYKNSNKNSLMKINILHSDITQQNQNIMKDMVKNMENISEFNFVDMSKIVTNNFFDKYMCKEKFCSYVSSETYYRLFIPNLFPQYDKVLYLDSDIIVCEDLTELYNTDIDNLYAGVVSVYKYFFKNVLSFNDDKIISEEYLARKLNILNKTYFNAGVLLLNLNEMRKGNIQEKSFKFLFENYPLLYQDQDILNSLFNNKIKFLDRRYNVYYRHFLDNKPTTVLHFAGPQKPWNSYKLNKGFELYWKYFKLTPFYNETEEKLYLDLKKVPPKEKKNIKIILGKQRYRLKIFHNTFSINPSFYRKSKKKILSLITKRKSRP